MGLLFINDISHTIRLTVSNNDAVLIRTKVLMSTILLPAHFKISYLFYHTEYWESQRVVAHAKFHAQKTSCSKIDITSSTEDDLKGLKRNHVQFRKDLSLSHLP